jgi:hypothetical protein
LIGLSRHGEGGWQFLGTHSQLSASIALMQALVAGDCIRDSSANQSWNNEGMPSCGLRGETTAARGVLYAAVMNEAIPTAA